MDQEKIGSFIFHLRKEKHLTQEQIVEKIGVTSKSVRRLKELLKVLFW